VKIETAAAEWRKRRDFLSSRNMRANNEENMVAKQTAA